MDPKLPAAKSNEDELRSWLVLWRTPGIGPVLFARLLSQCGSIGDALAEIGRGAGPIPLSEGQREALANPDWESADAELRWLSDTGATVVRIDDPAYPTLLRETAAPPPLLFVRGAPSLLAEPQLAMVGSRNPTPSGRETARDFARQLGRSGLAIISGLALGIDAESHRGALEAEAATVAVMATGLDRVYPARHRALAHEIAERGALVTEHPRGTQVKAQNFPRRNRIIAGLSVGTLVVEAARRSGSLITARLAAEQGREVFAIPGSIHSPTARGCHMLIRQGAKLVETAADVLEELKPLVEGVYAADEGHSSESSGLVPQALERDHAMLLEKMGYDPITVDQLVKRSRLTPAEVSSMLLILELQGRVDALPGGRYVHKG